MMDFLLKFLDGGRMFGIPAVLVVMIIATMINGGPNFDEWTLQRATIFTGLIVALAVTISHVPDNDG